MSNFSKFVGVFGVATLLTACGGGSSDGKPSNVPKEDLKPTDLTSELVPFKDKSIIDKIKELITGEPSQPQANIDYNVALGHMIGEVFGDYPIGRDGRIIKLYDMGKNAITWRNIICTDLKTVNTSKILTLKSANDTCINAANTLQRGSEVTVDTNGDTTTVTFKNFKFGSNVDFNLKDHYVVNGSIKHTKNSIRESYTTSALEYQRLEDNVSKEYLKLTDYNYLLETGSEEKYLTTKGKVSGQPYLADFSYDFEYETLTPFKMAKNVIGFNHLPKAGGDLRIVDRYFQIINVKQIQDQSLKAQISFNGIPVGELNWSEIIGSK